MIIQCPNCAFSGRIPNYAIAIPHNARCPKCAYRFELSDLLARPSTAISDADFSSEDEVIAPAFDPGSSSYELDAITDIPATDKVAFKADEIWDEFERDHRSPEDTESRTGSKNPSGQGNTLTTGQKSAVPLPTICSRNLSWIYRTLQAWSIFFLIWAVLVAGRILYSYMLTSVQTMPFTLEHFWAVMTVVVLVASAAGLSLLIEVAQYLQALGTVGEARAGRSPQRPESDTTLAFRARRVRTREPRPKLFGMSR